MFTKDKICDLHTHSSFSDGTLTPGELVSLAVESGLSTIALTDHNTVLGLPEFFRAGEGQDIKLIGGIEFSTEWRGEELHLIALGVKEEHFSSIMALVDDYREKKRRSTELLIDKLISAGYKIDKERIYKGVQGIINRAHIAMELVRCGYVSSREEAFSSILATGGEFYSPPKYIDIGDCVDFILSKGLVPVLAHPLFNIDADKLRLLLSELVPRGLVAMETIYSEYSDAESALADSIAREFRIVGSGGSDFHGDNKPDIKLGVGRGNLVIPPSIIDKLGLPGVN